MLDIYLSFQYYICPMIEYLEVLSKVDNTISPTHVAEPWSDWSLVDPVAGSEDI